MSNVALGVYEHYKGGRYTVIGNCRHHEKRHLMVVYVCNRTGSINVRPAFGVDGDPDGWLVPVNVATGTVERFKWIGVAE